MIPQQRLGMLAHWINERERIRRARAAGKPAPWTKDPILREWKFCNVCREHDYTTCWIARHWREPHRHDPDVWHAMIVARMLNYPPSLRAIGYPAPWQPEIVEGVLLARQERGEQVFGGAYKIGTGGKAVPKIPYIVECLDAARRMEYPPQRGDTLELAHIKLRVRGLGNFMAAQVVADLKHTAILAEAPDWWDWAAPGPGSLLGLGWLETGMLGDRASPTNFEPRLHELRRRVRPLLDRDVPRLSLQDLQNCLCELSKYVRGRGKTRYDPIAALIG